MDGSSSSDSWNEYSKKKDTRLYERSVSTESSSSDKISDMSELLNRLLTFENWPSDVVTSATELTNCGLFYTEYKDEVRCFECGVKLQNWKMDDIPFDRHKAASPDFKFLKLKYLSHSQGGANNFTGINSNSENNNKVTVNNKNGTSHRFTSGYLNYCENTREPSVTQNKLLLLSNDQNTQTNHQNNSTTEKNQQVTNIKSNNDVMNVVGTTENNEWFTVRDVQNQPLNQQEVDYTVESNRLASFSGHWSSESPISPNELAAAGLYFTGPGDRVQCASCRGGLYNFEAGDTAIGEHIRHFPECHFIKKKMSEMIRMPNTVNRQRNTDTNQTTDISQLTAVKIALEMDYPMVMIRKAVEKFDSPIKDITSEQLMDALFDLESDEEDTSINSSKIPEGATGFQSVEGIHITQIGENQIKDSTNPEELIKIVEENERLKGKTVCKICLDKAVDTLFLPCRHLVCCEECAEEVQQCPVCRTVIIGTVKTLLS